jgi:hypothetical protein
MVVGALLEVLRAHTHQATAVEVVAASLDMALQLMAMGEGVQLGG